MFKFKINDKVIIKPTGETAWIRRMDLTKSRESDTVMYLVSVNGLCDYYLENELEAYTGGTKKLIKRN